MRIILPIIGLPLMVLGLHWIGQGTGTFTWPSSPVMDNNPTWTYIGIASLISGFGLFAWARR